MTLKEVTYLGFTRVLLNIFKIKSKINETVKEILKFKPDILFSVDSPDFTLRVAKEVKKGTQILKQFILLLHRFGCGENIELNSLNYF